MYWFALMWVVLGCASSFPTSTNQQPIPPFILTYYTMPIDTHPMQRVFRGADGDMLRVRNKDALCGQCDRPAAKGERLRKCTGCKMSIYCSEECQRAAWPNHRCGLIQLDCPHDASRSHDAETYATLCGPIAAGQS